MQECVKCGRVIGDNEAAHESFKGLWCETCDRAGQERHFHLKELLRRHNLCYAG